MSVEVFVLPAFGQGHLFPCIELCKLIASRNHRTTLVLFSDLSPYVPSNFLHNPLLQIVHIPAPPGNDPIPMHPASKTHMQRCLETLLSSRTRPIYAIVDVLAILCWTVDIFKKFNIPTIGFFTSGACSASMEYATWKANIRDIKPGEIRFLQGLPEEMSFSISDLKRRPHFGPPPGPQSEDGARMKPKKKGVFGPGEEPSWVDETDGSMALMINTCDDLERPFLEYLTREIGKPVWGVGPLFSEQYWAAAGALVHDSKIRTVRQTNVTEEKVVQWLDSKPRGSVLYVAFGSSVDITLEEYPQLGSALEQSSHPFIWVIPKDAGRTGPPRGVAGSDGSEVEGYYPHGLDGKVGERGLIIHGWAPQLVILSHQSTGAFLSHCGWNSTMEALGRGVPVLAWPLRGDQYFNAKLVVSHLRVGCAVCDDDAAQLLNKEQIGEAIERVMGDDHMKARAEALAAKFDHGFPPSSIAALNAFTHFITGESA